MRTRRSNEKADTSRTSGGAAPKPVLIRRSNFVLGVGASVVLHAIVLAALLGAPGVMSQPVVTPQRAAPIQIASVDPDKAVPLDPLPTDPAPVPEPPAPEPPAPEPQPQPALTPTPLPTPPPQPDPVTPPKPEPPPQSLVRSQAEPPPPRAPDPTPEPPPAAPESEAVTAAAPPQPAATQDTAALARAAAPAAAPQEPDRDGRMPGDGDAQYVPPLRVHWRDADELISVARTLGMRLAAIDARGDIIGEIDLSSRPGLKQWQGLPYGYSNRVRMLSPSIFSTTLPSAGGADIREIWVFVPADRDRAMVEAQRSAVQRAGARPQDVRYVDGRFVRAANGSYRLDITGIRQADERRGVDG